MAAKTKKAAPVRRAKARSEADVWVTNPVTGLTHLVPAEVARTIVGRQDPSSGQVLFEDGQELAIPDGYDPDDPDTHSASFQDGENAAPVAVVTEAAYGVPDDAIASDAKAMAERGGQPKGTTAGPTIPQENRTDRGKREAGPHPLAKGSVAKGDVKPEGVDPDVAARHAASKNMPGSGDGDGSA